MNKKGIFRIIEATIAVLIVLGTILAVSSNHKTISEKEDFSKILRDVLDEIAKNVDLRKEIVEDTSPFSTAEDHIKAILENKIPYPNIGKDVVICDINQQDDCALSSYPSNAIGAVYSEERVVSSALNAQPSTPNAPPFKPKIVKIYIWNTE